MRGVEFRARGWRAEVIMALVVGLLSIGAATVTWWTGTVAGDLTWRLGADCQTSSIVDAAASGAAAFVLIVAMFKLGRWSRGVTSGTRGTDNTEVEVIRGALSFDASTFGVDGPTDDVFAS